jgi:hypothetical protein
VPARGRRYKESGVRPQRIVDHALPLEREHDHDDERDGEHVVVEHEPEGVELGLVLDLGDEHQVERRHDAVKGAQQIADHAERQISQTSDHRACCHERERRVRDVCVCELCDECGGS